MIEIPLGVLQHLLCILLLFARVCDVGTTYLATPTLALEANPIVRKLGWKFAIMTIALCVVPYWSPQVGLTLLMASLLVSASNAGKVWVMRTMGEQAYLSFCLELARKSKLSRALLTVAASAVIVVLAGAVIVLFYPSPSDDWGFWIGLGVALYGVVIGIYGSGWLVRLFRRAAGLAEREA